MYNSELRKDAEQIYSYGIQASLPDEAVKKTLSGMNLGTGKIIVISVGKAGWTMASAAAEVLKNRISAGLVVTKYDHSKGAIPGFEIIEAGHPVPDENSYKGGRTALDYVKNLSADDTVLFLMSGGGSALFELSDVSLEELQDINRQLLASGADIQKLNTIRKRISKVKGGRFALACAPARVITLILSDVLGNQPDMIASGPTCTDSSTCEEAFKIISDYHLNFSDTVMNLMKSETPKDLPNSEVYMIGSVSMLCKAAAEKAEELGYETKIVTDALSCEARNAGEEMAELAKNQVGSGKKLAFLYGGETVVHLKGHGLGGRNQELALAAAPGIAGLNNVAVFSVGSDGTDGPTDAAGGYADGYTEENLKQLGISIPEVLDNNDSYHALEKCGGLIVTGPTGTNVNDISVLLIK